MTPETKDILNAALKLPATERARLVNELLASLESPDEAIDRLWEQEVEDRIAAYRAGHLQSVSLHEVLAKYGR